MIKLARAAFGVEALLVGLGWPGGQFGDWEGMGRAARQGGATGSAAATAVGSIFAKF